MTQTQRLVREMPARDGARVPAPSYVVGGPRPPSGGDYDLAMSMPSQPPPTGWIRLTIQGSVMSVSFNTPSIRLNGHRMQSRYGTVDYPVPPGPWHIDADCQWMRTYGQAALDVSVAPGQIVEVFYAAPWHQFARGRMGFTPQKRPGLWAFLVPLAVIVVIAALVIVAAASV